ncbi:MAG: glycine cleavage T C-terminal barrel domain-containing protein [Actinomycetes bacterium]
MRYPSDLAEHRAVRTTPGLFDLCHMGEIEVTGPHAGDEFDYALVSRPSKIDVGRARYSTICDAEGGILDDLVVYLLEDQRYMVVANASNARPIAACLEVRAKGFDVKGRDVSHEWAFAVVNPSTGDRVGDLTSGAPSPTLGVSIAMAFVLASLSEAGMRLQVDLQGVREDADVAPLPFYRRSA